MKILLGVSGGIAVYKAAELTRELRRRGFDVQVAMTAGAQRFVTPLTFATLSTHPVLTSVWQAEESVGAGVPDADFTIEHTRVAQEIGAVLVAPATANTLARLAHGLADDALTTIALATAAPLFLAPAMNVQMWRHPATQENLATLQRRGAHVIAPESGSLACGVVGEGRLAEPIAIADALCTALRPVQDVAGEHILVTAGGTREPIDAVRFLGNRSSGKMGHAIAEAALARGATVTLVTAATTAPALPCETVQVNTAAEMQAAVLQRLGAATFVIMAAAVGDFRASHPATGKIKKSPTLRLDLLRNEDILQHVVTHRAPGTRVIGFAAETDNLLPEARRKLREKHLDAIVANDVSEPGAGFDAEWNSGVFVTPEREIALERSTKRAMADRILDLSLPLRAQTPPRAEHAPGAD